MDSRSCGGCSLCCKLLTIDELNKAAGDWCVHAAPGKGCSVYEARPTPCRTFQCYWLKQAALGEAWRPDRCGFLVRDIGADLLLVEVEPSKPDSWRRAPYYAQIKQWSRQTLAGKGMVVVKVRGAATVILPDAELEVGQVADSDTLSVGYEPQGAGRRAFATVTRGDGSSRRVPTS